jgi:hypothetical protein
MSRGGARSRSLKGETQEASPNVKVDGLARAWPCFRSDLASNAVVPPFRVAQIVSVSEFSKVIRSTTATTNDCVHLCRRSISVPVADCVELWLRKGQNDCTAGRVRPETTFSTSPWHHLPSSFTNWQRPYITSRLLLEVKRSHSIHPHSPRHLPSVERYLS